MILYPNRAGQDEERQGKGLEKNKIGSNQSSLIFIKKITEMMEKQEMKKICYFSTRYPSLYSVPKQIKIILIVAIQERSDTTDGRKHTCEI